MLEENSTLCTKKKDTGTLHIYINDEKLSKELFKDGKTRHIIVYVENKNDKYLSYSLRVEKVEYFEITLDNMMGLLFRDTNDWDYKDIIVHWGNNKATFVNDNNLSELTKDDLDMYDIKTIKDLFEEIK